MKLRKLDYITIFLCALAAALCGAGSPLSAPIFVISSSIGLIDSIKNKVLSGALINGIFLTLNLYMTFKNFL
jgi:hypothetical protein